MNTQERGRSKFKRYKTLLIIAEKVLRIFPLGCRVKLFEKRRYTKGILGMGIRYCILKSIARSCGDNVSIHEGCFILHPENLSVGDNVSIHPMCYIECGNNPYGVSIGNDVSIAHGTTIIATTHTFREMDKAIKDQPVISKKVKISDDVWIGAKASILCGVDVAAGCVIGANTVVTKSTSAYGVYVGSPARFIKHRYD